LWRLGPVAKDIFIDLSGDEPPVLLGEFVERDPSNDKVFKAKREFNDDEFSENDLRLLDVIITYVKDKPANYLIKHTHSRNSLWTKSAVKYGVLELLEKGLRNSTEYEVDFSLLFNDGSYLSERFEDSKENLALVKTLKG
jgi:hypothetical protein